MEKERRDKRNQSTGFALLVVLGTALVSYFTYQYITDEHLSAFRIVMILVWLCVIPMCAHRFVRLERELKSSKTSE